MKSKLMISPTAVTFKQKLLMAYAVVSRKVQTMNAECVTWYQLFLRADTGASFYRGEEITLSRGEVFAVKKRFQISRIFVQRGSLWLTVPGEARDILLHAGDKYEFTVDRWPVVIQAMSDSEMVCYR